VPAIRNLDFQITLPNNRRWLGFLIAGYAFFAAFIIGMLAAEKSIKAIAFLVTLPLMINFIKRPVNALIFCCPLLILIPPWYTMKDFGIPIVQLDVFRAASLFFTIVLFTGICTRRYVNLSMDRMGFVFLLLSVYSFISCIGFWDEVIMRTVYNLLYVPLLFYFCVKLIPLNRQHINIMEIMFITAGVVLAFVMLYESLILKEPLFVSPDLVQYPWLENEFNVFRAGGMTGSAPQAGLILGIIFFLACGRYVKSRGTLKIPYLTACTVILLAIFITYTRATWFAVLGGSLLYSYFTNRRKFILYLIVLLIAGAAVFLVPPDISDDLLAKGITRPGTLISRFAFWQEAFDIYTSSLKNMIFGIGYLGSREIDITRSLLLEEVGTHCYYLTILLETGIIGLFLFLLIIFISIRTMRRNLVSATSTRGKKSYVLLFSAVSTLFIANLVGEYAKSQNEAIIFMMLLSLLVNHPHLYLKQPSEKPDEGNEFDLYAIST